MFKKLFVIAILLAMVLPFAAFAATEEEALQAQLDVAKASDVMLDAQKELNVANATLFSAQTAYDSSIKEAQANLKAAQESYTAAIELANTTLKDVKDSVGVKQEAYNATYRAFTDAQYVVSKNELSTKITNLESTIATKATKRQAATETLAP